MSADRVLITGVTGFIGSTLARLLLEKGVCVRGLVRRGSSSRQPPGVEPVTGDLSDLNSLAGACRGCSVVYNSAAIVGEASRTGPEVDELHGRVNVLGAVALAKEALLSGVERFVQISTVGIYGATDRTITEDTPPSPDSVYHKTKYEADLVLLALHQKERLPLVIVRPPITVGPGNLKTHLLKMARLAARDRFPTFGSDLSQRLPLVEVRDLCAALELTARNGPAGETYIVSSGECYGFGQILESMARFSGGTTGAIRCPAWVGDLAAQVFEFVGSFIPINPPLTRQKLRTFRQDRVLSIEKARRVLGYCPKYTRLDDLLGPALRDYRERGLFPPEKPRA